MLAQKAPSSREHFIHRSRETASPESNRSIWRFRRPIHHPDTFEDLLRNKLEFNYGKDPVLRFNSVVFCFLARDEVVAAQGDFGFCFIFWSPGA
jgi:hypothetical protein